MVLYQKVCAMIIDGIHMTEWWVCVIVWTQLVLRNASYHYSLLV